MTDILQTTGNVLDKNYCILIQILVFFSECGTDNKSAQHQAIPWTDDDQNMSWKEWLWNLLRQWIVLQNTFYYACKCLLRLAH